MLGEIAGKLSHTTLNVSTGLDHVGDLLVADERIEVNTKKYANVKYRIQHAIGKKAYIGAPLNYTVRTPRTLNTKNCQVF